MPSSTTASASPPTDPRDDLLRAEPQQALLILREQPWPRRGCETPVQRCSRRRDRAGRRCSGRAAIHVASPGAAQAWPQRSVSRPQHPLGLGAAACLSNVGVEVDPRPGGGAGDAPSPTSSGSDPLNGVLHAHRPDLQQHRDGAAGRPPGGVPKVPREKGRSAGSTSGPPRGSTMIHFRS
jgi:hypothetical protein